MKVIGKGAEATIYLLHNPKRILKDRPEKKYRLKEIDDELRKTRTRKEAKILKKLEGLTPELINTDNFSKIEMEYIEGSLIKHIIDEYPQLAEEIGKQTGIMHDKNIIHGDLTTGNMILDKHDNIKFIDFGLAIYSVKTEDKAVDLHLFLEAVKSKHYKQKDKMWGAFLKGYNPNNKAEILKRLKIVERRGRNKQKA